MPAIPTYLTETEIAELIKGNEQAKIVYDWMKVRKLFTKASKIDKATFQFQGISGNKVSFIITQPVDAPRTIIVVSTLNFIPSHQEAISKLSPKEKDAFFWDLKRDLIFAPAQFGMHPNINDPKQIQFQKEISFDELTEGRLLNAMDAVSRSTIWTIMVMIRKFGAPVEV